MRELEHAQVQETVAVPREQMAVVNALAEAIRGGALRDPAQARELAGELSYSRRRPRSFMRPYVARMFGESGRAYVGNQALLGDAWKFALPDKSDVHVDAILTDISVRYQNSEYIGALVFPRVQVVKKSDSYFEFDRSDWTRNEARRRAPGTRAAGGGYRLSTATYRVVEWAFEHQIPDEVRDNADNPLDPDRDGAEFVADKIAMALEEQVKTLVNTSANWTTNATLTGTDQWSDYANSDPFDDVKTAKLTVRKQCLQPPNTGVMGVEVFETLALHPDLIDRCKYTGTNERPAMVTAEMMAALFGLEQLLVGGAVEDTAKEGATDSMAFMWGKHAWFGYVQPRPAINRISAGYVFTTGIMNDRYREDSTKSDYVRGCEEFDSKKVAAGAGYRIVDAIA